MIFDKKYQASLYEKFSRFNTLERQDATYPPYHEGDYLEEYFVKKFKEYGGAATRYLIPVNWTAVFNYKVKEGLGPGTPNHDLRKSLFQSISELNPEMAYFTVSTHDDAPQGVFPENTMHFLAGGNSKTYPQVHIPLISSGFKQVNDYQKMIFCSFVGSTTNPIRNATLQHLSGQPGFFIKAYNWEPEISNDKASEFKNVMEQSRFALCPRGYGATSYRMYEAIQLGSIPVYVSDKHLLPWANELDWSDFSVVVSEKQIAEIPNILKSFSEMEVRNMQRRLREVYPLYFTIPAVYNQIIKRI